MTFWDGVAIGGGFVTLLFSALIVGVKIGMTKTETPNGGADE